MTGSPGQDGLDSKWNPDTAFRETHDSLAASRRAEATDEAQVYALQAIAYALLGIGIQGAVRPRHPD